MQHQKQPQVREHRRQSKYLRGVPVFIGRINKLGVLGIPNVEQCAVA